MERAGCFDGTFLREILVARCKKGTSAAEVGSVQPTGHGRDRQGADRDCSVELYAARARSGIWPGPHGRVIANGRDAAGYSPVSKEPFVFTAGRLWDEAKNIGTLLRVASSLGWPVYVAGPTQHPGGGGSKALDGCRVLGQLDSDALRAWYARAAIYALPARYEPFGFTALEAALSGCALTLGDIPSLREIWQDAAIFLPPDDSLAWRSAIRRLARNCSQRSALGLNARRRALEFTADRMASNFAGCYLEAVSKRVRRGDPVCA